MKMMGSYKVNGKDIPYEVRDISQDKLQFYPENPRVFSIIAAKGIESQDEIEDCMRSMDHVKLLRTQIQTHGGLIDPIVVRAGDFVVLEGNSRLAAYRMLHDVDPITWNLVKCHVVPSDISADDIFELLGNWHISGKTAWTPYEQAAFLVRQLKASKKPLLAHAKSLGLTKTIAEQYVETYRFMVDHNDDDAHHWSHYLELYKNRAIEKYAEHVPELRETVAGQIKSGAIRDAKDIRKLGDMAKVPTKAAKKIMAKVATGDMTIYDGYEQIKDSGALDDVVKKIEKFRNAINDESFEAQCVVHKDIAKILYDLKNINKVIVKLMDKLAKVKKAHG